MACATDLMGVALPCQDKFLLFQLESLFSNFSLIGFRSLDLLVEKKRGTPKYFKFGGSLFIPNSF